MDEQTSHTSRWKRVLLGLLAVIVLGAGGWYIWDQGYLSDSVKLRDDLPLAPKGYDTINKDPQVLSELPQDRQDKYMQDFQDTLNAIKEHPDSQLAWNDLGVTKNKFGDYKGAEEAWVYATELTKGANSPGLYLNLADLYWNKLQNFERAEWAFRSAIEYDRATVRAYRDLASMYRFSYAEKKDQAIPVLIEGIENGSPEEAAELLALAGMWAWQDGDIDNAIIYYEEYVKLNPANEAAKSDLEELKKLQKR